VRRLLQISAGFGLAWLAAHLAGPAAAEPAPPAPSAEPAPLAPSAEPEAAPLGAAFDDDAAMAPHADPVADYTLRATLDADKHLVHGEGTIRWKNASSTAQREIWLHLYLDAFKSDRSTFLRFNAGDFRGAGHLSSHGSIEVTRLSLRGEGGGDLWAGADRTSPGDPDDSTDIRVPLPRPVAAGEEITLDVAFDSHLPALLHRTGFYGSFHMVAQWFPKIARLEPDGRWAHFRFHRLSEFYADFGAYDVTIDTPASFVVGATGEQEGEVREGARVRRRFVQRDVHDFAFTAWDRFRELTALTEGGVALRVLYPEGCERAAAAEIASARFGLLHLGAAYGRYPYRTLTIVHPPTGADDAGGMEYPTLITTGGPWYLAYPGVPLLDALTLHELAHQWFYGLVATDEHAWPFLDEGLTSYAENHAVEALHPGGSAVDLPFLRVDMLAYHRIAAAEAELDAPVAQPVPSFANGTDYAALVYSRTAAILATLGNVYGEPLVRRALGRYARRFRFQHPGPAELLQAVREVVGEDAAAQLRAALFDRGTVDYAVTSIESSADPAGGFRGSALVRRRGALRFPVDVELVSEDGASQRIRWDAAEASARLPWHGASRLESAVIDPEHRVLLDDDLANNARARRLHRLSFGVADRFSFATSALLGGVLP
jgi:hypothetical protein